MSLAQKTVANRHAVWALAIAAAVFGAWSYVSLPMQLFPDTAPPVVNVITPWPGASAEDVARDLSEPIEEEFAALDGIVRVRSTSQDNISLVSLEFEYGRPSRLAAIDAQNAIARIRGVLPFGIGEPQVLTFSTADRPVVTVGVVAEDLSVARVRADEALAPRLQRLPGVAAVDVFGGHLPAVLVEVTPRALEAHRIPPERVAAALREHNAARPSGRIRSEYTQTMYRLEAWASDIAALEAIAIPTPEGGRVLLGDLATIRLGTLDPDASFAVDGRDAIAMQVFRSDDANIVATVGHVVALLPELARQHPDLTFVVGEESATFTEISVSNLLGNVGQALLLASVIIFLFLGRLRSSFVTVISMPLSYGITFALMKMAGVELDMVTLSAIILAVGMVVDATVVVLENVTRRRSEEGLSAEAAAVAGTDEVRLPVLAGAATTLVVLVPLQFLDGFIGKTFGPLALTLIFAFLSSVVVALVLVPVLTLYTGSPGGRLDRLTGWLVLPFTWSMERLRDGYGWLLRKALRRRWIVVGLALAVFGGAVTGIRALGMDVLPHMDGGSFFVALETPSGSSLAATARVAREIEAILADEREVVLYQTQVGLEAGMRSAGGTGAQGPNQAYVTVTLTPRTARDESIQSITARVAERLAAVPGIQSAVVRETGNTAKATTIAPVVVRLTGPDPLVLDHLAGEVTARLETVPGVVGLDRSWRIDQRRTRVEVDALRAGQLGLSDVDVAAQLARGLEGLPAGEFRPPGEPSRPLLVRYARSPTPTPDDILALPLFALHHADPVPARALVRTAEVTGQGIVTREALQNTLDVTASVQGRPLSFVNADLEALFGDFPVPVGYDVALEGENRDLDEARGELLRAFAVAIVAVYLLLVAQLRSFLHPLTILLALPLSLVGVPIALALAGKAVSMPVMVGLILLVGTVVNNAIILLDFVTTARGSGTPRRAALEAAVATRFRPIMMTSLSTIVGMIPLAGEWALGAERFSPLAVAVIGGMTAGTLLTLVVIPVFYDLFDDAGRLLSRDRTAH